MSERSGISAPRECATRTQHSTWRLLPTDLAALDVVAAAVQARRTTAARMHARLDARLRTPRRAWLEGVLQDVATGACSVLEHGYLNHVERAHGLPRAERQPRATSTSGVVYRDVDYETLLVELDGRLFHDTAAQRDRDIDRDLDAAVGGRTTIRLGYGQVFDRPCLTAFRLAALLQKRGCGGQPLHVGPNALLEEPDCHLVTATLLPVLPVVRRVRRRAGSPRRRSPS